MNEYDRRQLVQRRQFLATLTPDCPVLGLLGIGFERSFYKVYVRRAPQSAIWWRFDSTGWASKCHHDPVAYQRDLEAAGRGTPSQRLRLVDLPDWKHIESPALAQLFTRARELRLVGSTTTASTADLAPRAS